jgi:hypothetical protein
LLLHGIEQKFLGRPARSPLLLRLSYPGSDPSSVTILTGEYVSLPLHVSAEPRWRSRYSDWLRAGRPRGRSSSPGSVKNFLQVVQTGSGAHPVSYPKVRGAPSPGVKRHGREADHSPPTSA